MECCIRKWKIEDADELAQCINNKNVQDNLRDGIPFPYTKEDAKDYINMMLKENPDKTFAFAIVADNKVVGSIGVFRKDNIHFRTAELGYYVAEPYWGKGVCTKAVKQICDYVFENTDVIRIFAEPFAHNTASCRVLEKAGFVFEGLLRKNAVKNDMILDMKMYALIKNKD